MFENILSNPEAITSIYGDLSVLHHATLQRLSFREAGALATIQIEVAVKPARPPLRWDKDINATAIELQMVGLRDLLLTAWHPERPPKIRFLKGAGGSVELSTDDGSLSVVCDFVVVATVSGYLTEKT